jgi:hypothetical protein
MATNEEVLNPKSLVVPTIVVGNQTANAQTGTVGISGATLVFFNGSAWKYIAGS